jgi:hypothetical protein
MATVLVVLLLLSDYIWMVTVVAPSLLRRYIADKYLTLIKTFLLKFVKDLRKSVTNVALVNLNNFL